MRNPLSLEAFADWLATMPPEEEYDYCEPQGCAVSLYLRSLGISRLEADSISPFGGNLMGGPSVDPKIMRVIQGRGKDKWTFGAAHQRARDLLKGA